MLSPLDFVMLSLRMSTLNLLRPQNQPCQSSTLSILRELSAPYGVYQRKPGLDIIPTNIMKQCQAEFAFAISHIANLSFIAGPFPATMKNNPNVKIAWPGHRQYEEFTANYQFVHDFQNYQMVGVIQTETSHCVISKFQPFTVCLPSGLFD